MKIHRKRLSGILLIPFLLFFIECSSQKNIAQSEWSTGQIQIDGDLSDWGEQLRFYDKASKISYSVQNDSNNLYFCLRVVDETMQMKVLRAGLEVGLDTTGKKDKHISIKYPRREKADITTDRGQPRPDFSGLKRNFRKEIQLMELSGFVGGNGLSALQSTNGVIARLDWNQHNEMVYELCIPYHSYQKANLIRPDSSKLMCLYVTIPALEVPSFVRDGGPPPGIGRPGGGGPPSWVTGGGGNESLTMLLEEQTIFQKFFLTLH